MLKCVTQLQLAERTLTERPRIEFLPLIDIPVSGMFILRATQFSSACIFPKLPSSLQHNALFCETNSKSLKRNLVKYLVINITKSCNSLSCNYSLKYLV